MPFYNAPQNVLIPINTHSYASQQRGLHIHHILGACVPPLHTHPGQRWVLKVCVSLSAPGNPHTVRMHPQVTYTLPSCGSLHAAPCPATLNCVAGSSMCLSSLSGGCDPGKAPSGSFRPADLTIHTDGKTGTLFEDRKKKKAQNKINSQNPPLFAV